MRPARLNRRQLIQGVAGTGLSAAGLALLGGCSRLPLRPPGRPGHIAYLTFGPAPPPGSAPSALRPVEILSESLQALGHVEGRDFAIERYYTGGQADRLRVVVKELVELPADVIVVDFANSLAVAQACREATSTIPIVAVSIDLELWRAAGLVESVTRPGGNLTGRSIPGPEIRAKQLQLLKQAVPGAARVAVLRSTEPAWVPGFEVARAAAPELGVQIVDAGVGSLEEVDGAIERAAEAGAQAVLVISGSFLLGRVGNIRVIEVVARHRLPTLFGGGREHADYGGLMSYQSDVVDAVRRGAYYVHRILEGARPGDLPIEGPTKFDFVINLKTARELGLTIPPDLLAQATDVIQ